MPADLKGRAIAISGASSGIGAATALACARAGMPLALCARRRDKLDAVAQRCRREGVRVYAAPVDVAQADACRAFIRDAVADLGGLYAVYANAGYGMEMPILDMTDAQVREIFEVNFFGTLNLIRPAVEHFLSRPRPPRGARGHVLICSSCLAKMTIPFYGAYSATKAAQSHVGRAMRLELEPERVAVSIIHPITTKTELFETAQRLSKVQKVVPHAPAWLCQTPEVVAKHTLACLRRPKAEVWTGLRGRFVRLGMSVCTLAPWLADANTRKMVRAHAPRSASA